MPDHLTTQAPTGYPGRIERDHPGKSNAISRAVAGLLALLAVLVASWSLYLTWLLQWDGPFRDLWEFVDDLERQFAGHWDLSYLFEAYGGAHRIVLPKLVFFADYYGLGGRNLLTILVALSCQCGYLWVMVRALQREQGLSAPMRLALLASMALALFSVTQVFNFLYAMDVQWHLSNLFGLLSLSLLARPPAERSWAAILACGVAAALCNFTGLMALPIAILVLCLERPARLQQWAPLAVMVPFCLWYVHHDQNQQQIVFSALRASDNWQTTAYIVYDTLTKMLPYVLRYLSSPLSRDWPLAGSGMAALGLVLLAYYWLRHWRGTLTAWQRLCLYIATYIAASAFFTAFGRLIYPNSATAERYQTLVLPWLPALAGLCWPDFRSARAANGFALSWLVVWAWVLGPAQVSSTREMSQLSYQVSLAHTAARAGVLELPHVAASLSYPLLKNGINSVKDNDAFLRSEQLGYFRHLPDFAAGTRLQLAEGLPPCTGNTSPRQDAKTRSWLLDGQLHLDSQPVTDIVLLQQERIIGLGILLRPPGFLLPARWQAAENAGFRAFAPAGRLDPEAPLTLLGIRDGTVVCTLMLPAHGTD